MHRRSPNLFTIQKNNIFMLIFFSYRVGERKSAHNWITPLKRKNHFFFKWHVLPSCRFSCSESFSVLRNSFYRGYFGLWCIYGKSGRTTCNHHPSGSTVKVCRKSSFKGVIQLWADIPTTQNCRFFPWWIESIRHYKHLGTE